MSDKDRTAAATAGEHIMADNVPPVNYAGNVRDRMLDVYGALRGVRDDFKEVVAMFRSVQDIDKRLMAIEKFSLPAEWNCVGKKVGVNCHEATDEGFVEQIHAYTQGKNNVARLAVLTRLAKLLHNAVRDAERKYAKLDERVRLQKRNSPEWQTAVDLRKKSCDAVSVLKSRKVMIAGMFFDTRKRIAEDLLEVSSAMASLFLQTNGKYEEQFVCEMLKKDAAGKFDEIARMDCNVRREGESASYRRKGWKV